MKRYDFIIIGAGASGLSLACHLVASPLRDRSILIVERSFEGRSNHIWAFWTKPTPILNGHPPTPIDDVPSHAWHRLLAATPRRTMPLRIAPYTYRAIRGADFYSYANERLSAFPNVEFLEGEVGAVEEGEGGASICIGGEQYEGQWVFDSRFSLAGFHPGPRRRYLRMQIRGWNIETGHPSFDPQTATFLDFRTPQASAQLDPGKPRTGRLCFLYVLPFDEQHALVEHVACIPARSKLLHAGEQQQALKDYIEGTLGIVSYRVVSQEQGVNPMTDYPFPRRSSRHVMTIGIPGGMLKPSTGFAFARIQRDSAAIVRSLEEHGQPFNVPRTGWIYRRIEPLMLWAMARHGEFVGSLLGALFRVGRTPRILGFLDEEGLPL